MKKWGFCCIVAALILSLGTVATQATIYSTFDTDSEGWGVVNDAYPIDWNSTGGNPGGFIYSRDRVQGYTWFFTAPAQFLGDLTPYIGGTLSYDFLLILKGGGYYNDREVVIKGAGQTIRGNVLPDPHPPLGTWTSYSIDLLPANFEVTDTVFTQVLANVTDLWIRGEYISGSDTEGLDNVRLNIIPLPGTVVFLVSGLLGLTGWRGFRKS